MRLRWYKVPDLVFATSTARYIHPSFGLRYLKANLDHSLNKPDHVLTSELIEFETVTPVEAVELLIKKAPKIVCFSVYIWNVEFIRKCAVLLRKIAPTMVILCGGPEVQALSLSDPLVESANYIVRGEGELIISPLVQFCLSNASKYTSRNISKDTSKHTTSNNSANSLELLLSEVAKINGKVINALPPDLSKVILPYYLYNEEDIKNRVIYVETGRGCPFNCHYCASSLDDGVRAFPLESVLNEFEKLLERGVFHFKFVDRSFNCEGGRAEQVLKFFLQKYKEENKEFYLHFEFLPVRLSDSLKTLLKQFPEKTLHIEVGVQTFSKEIGQRVGRTIPPLVVEETLKFLLNETKAIVHGDLIIGLPGDTVDSLSESFNKLWNLGVYEIQLNLLKCLGGTPLISHSDEFTMKYSDSPPYEVLSTSTMDFLTIRKLHECSRVFNMLCQSDNFPQVSRLIINACNNPMESLFVFTDYILNAFGRSHHISLKVLLKAVFEYLTIDMKLSPAEAGRTIAADYYDNGRRKKLPWLEEKY